MSYGNPYQSNPYGQAQEAGHGYGNQEQHELQQYGQHGQQQYDDQYGHPYGQTAAPAAAQTLSQNDFLSRVSATRSDIAGLTTDISQVAALHQRALTSSDQSAQHQLDNLVASTQLKTTSIRDQLARLKADAEKTTDSSKGIKQRQFKLLNDEFKKKIQDFLQEEQAYRARYREQISRQYRIVNPEASEAEAQAAAEQDWGNEGIFQQALRSNRSGQASAVLGNVRARHNELVKIEQSLNELAGLLQDLDTLVIQQDPIVARAEEMTEQTNVNLNKANDEVAVANKHARNRRRLKWICLFVVILIIIAIALGVGLGVYFARQGSKTVTNSK